MRHLDMPYLITTYASCADDFKCKCRFPHFSEGLQDPVDFAQNQTSQIYVWGIESYAFLQSVTD